MIFCYMGSIKWDPCPTADPLFTDSLQATQAKAWKFFCIMSFQTSPYFCYTHAQNDKFILKPQTLLNTSCVLYFLFYVWRLNLLCSKMHFLSLVITCNADCRLVSQVHFKQALILLQTFKVRNFRHEFILQLIYAGFHLPLPFNTVKIKHCFLYKENSEYS